MHKYEYNEKGQNQNKDDVLNNNTKWQAGLQGQVQQGGTFGPGGAFPNGTIMQNATIISPVRFQDGCIFDNCTFIMLIPWTTFGTGAVFNNCTLSGTKIPKDAVLNNCKIIIAINESQFINNKREAKGGPSANKVESTHKRGTRIDSLHKDVTLQSGIKGYGNVKWKTNKSEEKEQQI